jgi:hypothetical protein
MDSGFAMDPVLTFITLWAIWPLVSYDSLWSDRAYDMPHVNPCLAFSPYPEIAGIFSHVGITYITTIQVRPAW